MSALADRIRALRPEQRQLLAGLLQPADEPIAIVGLGCRFPGGASSPEAFWSLLRDGGDGVTEVPADRWPIADWYDADPGAPGKMYTRWGGFLPDVPLFDNEFFGVAPGEARRMDPQQRLLLEVTWEALEHAGFAADDLAGSQTGVFVGLMPNDYGQLQLDAEGRRCYSDPYFSGGTSASMATGRLSYLLDLRGPSMAVDTACSSSLVAVHLACQSLRGGECDLALAAGVNAVVLPDVMVQLCKLGMLSASGHCRTFDAAADGFAVGEGAGVVVLKRLGDAVRDGDSVAAVIRGSATNEDGRTTTVTAPSALAQAAVIRAALAAAGVTADQLDYVEAHGSATAVGDPIEIEAIEAILGRRERPLAIGSVKSNIGHLEAAAGMAGLIKTVLALQHGEIPPNLHLTRPNPAIDWDAGSVTVPTAVREWPCIDRPRLAGVSSFGWAGTNAHVVVGQAPEATPPTPAARRLELLTISARTPAALDAATANLEAHLRAAPGEPLSDVAYTLQTGRQAFGERRVVLCEGRREAMRGLASGDPACVVSSSARPGRPVAFLLAGLGDHHLGMAAELHATEPAFRDAVAFCCAVLEPELGLDLRAVLYPGDSAAEQPLSGFPRSPLRATASAAWQRLDVIHSAMFVTTYALAQLWIGWGVRPQALVGNSLGEYVAACLAGVLAPEDALRLVTARARLIEPLPAGVMLAVAGGEESVAQFLEDGVELAVVTGPTSCVLAGPPEAVAGLEERLLAQEIACRPIDARHAFHTSSLAPAQQELRSLVGSLHLAPPEVPYLSNVTGDWITGAQATDPTYWAEHMVRTVRFGDALAKLLAQPDQVLLEVGPGQVLGSFAKLHPACSRDQRALVLPTLPAAHERRSDAQQTLWTLGRLWAVGVTVDWRAFQHGERRHRVSLPTYPFERRRFWVDPSPTPDVSRDEERAPVEKWLHLPGWRDSAPRRPRPGAAERGRCWLVLADDHGLGARLGKSLTTLGADVVTVRGGNRLDLSEPGFFRVRPDERGDFDALLARLAADGHKPEAVVHVWATGPEGDSELASSFHSLIALAQALGDRDLDACRLVVVSSGVHDVTGSERPIPGRATLLGPVLTIAAEYPQLTCTHVDIAGEVPDEHLLGELIGESRETEVALRGRRRWVRAFERLPADGAPTPPLREGGVYLITGGLGGLGLAVAEDIVRRVRARLILVGRSGLPPREQRANVLDGNGGSALAARIRRVAALEAAGAELVVVAADVTSAEQMEAVVAEAIARFGRVDGAFHAAGVPGHGSISLKSRAEADAVLAPKVHGTLALAHALHAARLDFLVLFSSLVTAVAGPGQADYRAANAFLDAYARRHFGDHGTTVAIAWAEWRWTAWDETLAGYDKDTRRALRERRHRLGMTDREGADALWRALAAGVPNVIVSPEEIAAVAEAGAAMTPDTSAVRTAERFPRPALTTPFVAPHTGLEREIAACWAEQLGLVKVGIDDSFLELGGNSLVGVAMLHRVRRRLGIDRLPAHLLYEAPTVAALARAIEQPDGEARAATDRRARGQQRRARQLGRAPAAVEAQEGEPVGDGRSR